MEDLPHDMIVEICEKSDISTLGTLMRTSDRNYKICSEVINKRIDVEINYINDRVDEDGSVDYILDNYKLSFDRVMDYLRVTESEYNISSMPKYLPYELSDERFFVDSYGRHAYGTSRVAHSQEIDDNNLKRIVKIMLSNGFKRNV